VERAGHTWPGGQGSRRLTVLAGPTAVGKGTVSADIRARYPEVWLSVSATTRPPRPGDVDGQHYHFVTPAEQALARGRAALLEIDLQGARQVRASMPGALFVFLAPPSWEELVRRLVGRGTETAEERERRLDNARLELAAQEEFDVTIVNADVHQATDDLVQCMGLVPRPLGVARG